MDRAHEWLRPTMAHWDGIRKQWRFPSGARLSFGYLQTATDRYRYQGAQFQSIGFDELTQFEERDYVYLFSRLRAPKGLNVPLRMRAATNPGGIGHEWVKRRFLTEPHPDRRFVGARISDNPSLDAEEYLRSLEELDSVTRAQLRDGDWLQDTSGRVYRVGPANILRGTYVRRGRWTFIAAHDYGVVDSNAISVLGWEQHSDVVHLFRSFYVRGLADDMAREHRAIVDEWHPERTIGDIGGLGKAFAGELMSRHNIPIQQASKSDKLGYIKLFNGGLERGKIVIHADGCADLLSEYENLMRAKDGSEVKTQANHCADSALYGWRECRAYMSLPKPPAKTQAQVDAAEAEEARRLMAEEQTGWVD